MHPNSLRTLTESSEPFVSVYFEDSHDTEDGRTRLELSWRGIEEELRRNSSSEETVDALRAAVLDAPPAVGRSGRGLIAAGSTVLIDERLIGPPVRTEVRVSELPYLVPLFDHGPANLSYLLAWVDHAGADITVQSSGGTHQETVDAVSGPIHQAAGAESAGYGTPQRRTDDAARRNVGAVADRVTELVDQRALDVVFVAGEVRSRSDLRGALPERTADVVVDLDIGARGSGDHSEELGRAIDEEIERRRLAAMDDAAQTWSAELGRGSGLAIDGVDDVCAALRDGSLATVLIGDLPDVTVVSDESPTMIAPDPDALSAFGVSPTRTLRADEAVPYGALHIDAEVIRVDERISPRDGIEGLRRYAV
ncbi:hypothetical protein ASG56_02650 [Rhodococcus sp. Leaf7]|uniref:Rv2629 family ribosome hibernation factor n=1 Tax=unclassified Rhodococcus (in: high G+C Gram-positive bacteria) TaxID=192944 RepID=UPI0006FB4AC2|nr:MULTISPECIES: hypothetical protein [unclassified Rhodococcus (in: high G+C Gram-positive bacteria)]KQU06576.1 hypothetical protein ASG56_02650 [Rhodococcus sp. Leaf7]KQU42094.1 hypothetical protein ASG64_02650 [Rhodococcus sp. Leaf247]